MTQNDILDLLKSDLGLVSLDEAMTKRLNHLINAAVEAIDREGGDIGSGPYSHEEAQLVQMYAAYMFRKRATDEGMPKMLRFALNNYIFAKKARG